MASGNSRAGRPRLPIKLILPKQGRGRSVQKALTSPAARFRERLRRRVGTPRKASSSAALRTVTVPARVRRRAASFNGLGSARGGACRCRRIVPAWSVSSAWMPTRYRQQRVRDQGPFRAAFATTSYMPPDSAAVRRKVLVVGRMPISATSIGISAQTCTLRWCRRRRAVRFAAARLARLSRAAIGLMIRVGGTDRPSDSAPTRLRHALRMQESGPRPWGPPR